MSLSRYTQQSDYSDFSNKKRTRDPPSSRASRAQLPLSASASPVLSGISLRSQVLPIEQRSRRYCEYSPLSMHAVLSTSAESLLPSASPSAPLPRARPESISVRGIPRHNYRLGESPARIINRDKPADSLSSEDSVFITTRRHCCFFQSLANLRRPLPRPCTILCARHNTYIVSSVSAAAALAGED